MVIANVQKQTFENVSVSSPHQASTSVTCTAMKNGRHPVAEGCGVVVVMTCGRRLTPEVSDGDKPPLTLRLTLS